MSHIISSRFFGQKFWRMKHKTVRIEILEFFTCARHHRRFDNGRLSDPNETQYLTKYVKVEPLRSSGSRYTNKNYITFREFLPIFTCKRHLLKLVGENQVLVVVGETGSGKTTQMTQYEEGKKEKKFAESFFPRYMMEAGYGKVCFSFVVCLVLLFPCVSRLV